MPHETMTRTTRDLTVLGKPQKEDSINLRYIALAGGKPVATQNPNSKRTQLTIKSRTLRQQHQKETQTEITTPKQSTR